MGCDRFTGPPKSSLAISMESYFAGKNKIIHQGHEDILVIKVGAGGCWCQRYSFEF